MKPQFEKVQLRNVKGQQIIDVAGPIDLFRSEKIVDVWVQITQVASNGSTEAAVARGSNGWDNAEVNALMDTADSNLLSQWARHDETVAGARGSDLARELRTLVGKGCAEWSASAACVRGTFQAGDEVRAEATITVQDGMEDGGNGMALNVWWYETVKLT